MELVLDYLSSWKIDVEKQINIISEWIEVDRATYHNWMFQNRITHNGNKLRLQVQKWVKSNKAEVLETALVKTRSGNRGTSISVREFIYPTEFDPPEVPAEVDLDGPESKAPMTPDCTTAFGSRNLGVSLQVDPVLGADNYTIDINPAPEIVKVNGFSHWPTEGDPFFTISMPRFHKVKATANITITNGDYALLSTHRPLKGSDPERRKHPIVLNFIRADIEVVGPPR